MSKKRLLVILGLAMILQAIPLRGVAADIYSVRLYFGLSIPGGGTVSMKEWDAFRDEHIAKSFDSFNEMDSVGYWKGQPEPSKIVTIVMAEEQVPDAEKLATTFATLFHQESVMLVQYPATRWEFLAGTKEDAKN